MNEELKHVIINAIESFVSMKNEKCRLAYLQSVRKLATYLSIDEKTIEFAERIESFTATEAAGFYAWLRKYIAVDGQTLADATISQRFHLIRRLFRYLVGLGLVKFNPFDAIHYDVPRRQRRQKRPTKLISFEIIDRILDMPDRRTKEGRRDYCFLCILFGGGLRRSEAWALNVDDVVISQTGTLCLSLRNTKNGQTQLQSLPSWAAGAFSELVSQRHGEGARPGDPLFVFYHCNGLPRDRLAVETLYRIYGRYTEKAGLGKIAPHSARASAATYLLSQGCSEISVANFLRHENENQVRVYDKRARSPEQNPGITIDYQKTKRKA
jgi:integrase/recombinase XerD